MCREFRPNPPKEDKYRVLYRHKWVATCNVYSTLIPYYSTKNK